jgi:ribosomal protein S27AE
MRRSIAKTAAVPWSSKRAALAVLRLLRLSRLQDHQADRRRTEASRRSARREMPAMRQQPGAEVRALRRVRRLQQLSEMQVREAEDHRRECPNCSEGEVVERRSKRGKHLLRLQPLSGMRFRRVGQAHSNEKCPDCGGSYLIEKFLKAGSQSRSARTTSANTSSMSAI